MQVFKSEPITLQLGTIIGKCASFSKMCPNSLNRVKPFRNLQCLAMKSCCVALRTMSRYLQCSMTMGEKLCIRVCIFVYKMSDPKDI